MSTPLLQHAAKNSPALYDRLDDLRRDNALMQAENDRLHQELKCLKSELEKSTKIAKETIIKSTESAYEIKYVVKECASQIEQYSRRESQLLTMYDRVKRENRKLRAHVDSLQEKRRSKYHYTDIQPSRKRTPSMFVSHPFELTAGTSQDVDETVQQKPNTEQTTKSQSDDTSTHEWELFSPRSILKGLTDGLISD